MTVIFYDFKFTYFKVDHIMVSTPKQTSRIQQPRLLSGKAVRLFEDVGDAPRTPERWRVNKPPPTPKRGKKTTRRVGISKIRTMSVNMRKS